MVERAVFFFSLISVTSSSGPVSRLSSLPDLGATEEESSKKEELIKPRFGFPASSPLYFLPLHHFQANAVLEPYQETDNCYITRPSSAGKMGISVT